jgi:hypothetical protein
MDLFTGGFVSQQMKLIEKVRGQTRDLSMKTEVEGEGASGLMAFKKGGRTIEEFTKGGGEGIEPTLGMGELELRKPDKVKSKKTSGGSRKRLKDEFDSHVKLYDQHLKDVEQYYKKVEGYKEKSQMSQAKLDARLAKENFATQKKNQQIQRRELMKHHKMILSQERSSQEERRSMFESTAASIGTGVLGAAQAAIEGSENFGVAMLNMFKNTTMSLASDLLAKGIHASIEASASATIPFVGPVLSAMWSATATQYLAGATVVGGLGLGLSAVSASVGGGSSAAGAASTTPSYGNQYSPGGSSYGGRSSSGEGKEEGGPTYQTNIFLKGRSSHLLTRRDIQNFSNRLQAGRL